MESIKKARVISIEGGEGAGKSTIIQEISQYFTDKNIPYIITREPGGVRISEKIREIILNKEFSEMDSRTEALLFAAARRQHLIEKVLPAIEEGKIVIFDRFVDSSLVYQGYVRNIGIEEVYEINQFAIEGFIPDLTIYVDVDPVVGLERINKNPDREINKLDLEGLEFHTKVREGYHLIMKTYPKRIVMIDGNQSLSDVVKATLKEIEVRI